MSTVSIEGKAYPIEEHYQALYRYGKNDAKRHGSERLRTLLSAEYILNGCNLLKDSVIVDWGCHCGFFSLALADEKVRNKYQGGIVGIDYDKRNINPVLKKRRGLLNPLKLLRCGGKGQHVRGTPRDFFKEFLMRRNRP